MKQKIGFIVVTAFGIVLPLLTAFLLYPAGYRTFIINIIIAMTTLCIGFATASGRISFAVLCLTASVSATISEILSTYFYYTRISSDSETILIGELSTFFIFGASAFFSIMLLLLKRKPCEDTSRARRDAYRKSYGLCIKLICVVGAVTVLGLLLIFVSFNVFNRIWYLDSTPNILNQIMRATSHLGVVFLLGGFVILLPLGSVIFPYLLLKSKK